MPEEPSEPQEPTAKARQVLHSITEYFTKSWGGLNIIPSSVLEQFTELERLLAEPPVRAAGSTFTKTISCANCTAQLRVQLNEQQLEQILFHGKVYSMRCRRCNHNQQLPAPTHS